MRSRSTAAQTCPSARMCWRATHRMGGIPKASPTASDLAALVRCGPRQQWRTTVRASSASAPSSAIPHRTNATPRVHTAHPSVRTRSLRPSRLMEWPTEPFFVPDELAAAAEDDCEARRERVTAAWEAHLAGYRAEFPEAAKRARHRIWLGRAPRGLGRRPTDLRCGPEGRSQREKLVARCSTRLPPKSAD